MEGRRIGNEASFLNNLLALCWQQVGLKIYGKGGKTYFVKRFGARSRSFHFYGFQGIE